VVVVIFQPEAFMPRSFLFMSSIRRSISCLYEVSADLRCLGHIDIMGRKSSEKQSAMLSTT
jgi:hypothetical protein